VNKLEEQYSWSNQRPEIQDAEAGLISIFGRYNGNGYVV